MAVKSADVCSNEKEHSHREYNPNLRQSYHHLVSRNAVKFREQTNPILLFDEDSLQSILIFLDLEEHRLLSK